jgi:hypothetical protein
MNEACKIAISSFPEGKGALGCKLVVGLLLIYTDSLNVHKLLEIHLNEFCQTELGLVFDLPLLTLQRLPVF